MNPKQGELFPRVVTEKQQNGQQQRPPHDFDKCLKRSHRASDLPFWEEVYRAAFPDMEAMLDERQFGPHQLLGVDRKLILPGTRQVLVDEKVRGTRFNDIALEFISNDRTGAPGWVCKPLLAEYIAYAIAPLGKCFLLPVLPLQAAWREHGEQWKQEYGEKFAPNRGYKTHFTPVPEAALFRCLGGWHRVSFTPFEIPADIG